MRNNCHESELLNSYIGKKVIVSFKCGTEEMGILTHPDFGNGYKLLGFYGYDVRFYKSLVKSVREAEE